MATYLLLNKKILRFSAVRISAEGRFDLNRKNENKAEVEIEPVAESGASSLLLEQIELGNAQMDVDLRIVMMLPPCTNEMQGFGILRVDAVGENHILKKIYDLTNGRITMNCMGNFSAVPTVVVHSWKMEGLEVNRSQRFDHSFTFFPAFTSLGKIHDIPVNIVNDWQKGKPFLGEFSISVVVSESSFPPPEPELQLEFDTSKPRKLLTCGIETDIELVSRLGKIFKCHKAYLAFDSKIFFTFFKEQKGISRLGLTEHLSMECLQALLAFIYCKDLSEVFTSVEFCLEVLKAAIEFQVFGLIPHIQKHIEAKSNNELSVEEASKLYEVIKSDPIDTSNWDIEEDDDDEMDQDYNPEAEEGGAVGEGGEGLEEEETESGEGDLSNESESNESIRSNDSETDGENSTPQTQSVGKRISIEQNDQAKRFRSEVVRRSGKNMALLRLESDSNVGHSSATGADILENENENGWTGEVSEEEAKSFLQMLECKAKKIIFWYLQNNKQALLDSDELRSLEGFPKLFVEVVLNGETN